MRASVRHPNDDKLTHRPQKHAQAVKSIRIARSRRGPRQGRPPVTGGPARDRRVPTGLTAAYRALFSGRAPAGGRAARQLAVPCGGQTPVPDAVHGGAVNKASRLQLLCEPWGAHKGRR